MGSISNKQLLDRITALEARLINQHATVVSMLTDIADHTTEGHSALQDRVDHLVDSKDEMWNRVFTYLTTAQKPPEPPPVPQYVPSIGAMAGAALGGNSLFEPLPDGDPNGYTRRERSLGGEYTEHPLDGDMEEVE